MEPKWICILVGMAACLGFGVLFHHPDAATAAGTDSLAQSIITGAFGIAVGHSLASKNNLSELPPGSAETTTTQTPPLTPGEPTA